MLNIKDLRNVVAIPVLISSLCCLAPIVLVLVGLSTITFAASLTDILDGQYRWLFDLAGVLGLTISIFVYFKKQGICTLDQARRHKNEVINKILLFFIFGVVLYWIFFYVILNEVGKLLHIW